MGRNGVGEGMISLSLSFEIGLINSDSWECNHQNFKNSNNIL